MDIHAFINRLIEDTNNKDLVEDIRGSSNVVEETNGDNLILQIPAIQGNEFESDANYIHGHIFEEYVLKAAVKDIGKNEEDVNKKIQERENMFSRIYGRMEDAYKDTMIRAGSDAWEILSKIFANPSAYKTKEGMSDNSKDTKYTKLAFEETIPNTLTTLLTEKPRADLVAEIGEKVFIVDFKYTSWNQKMYEKKRLVEGLIQVLIYAIFIGKDPRNLTLGVLVYYARIGRIVLYSTNKIREETCVNKLKEIAEIRDITRRMRRLGVNEATSN